MSTPSLTPKIIGFLLKPALLASLLSVTLLPVHAQVVQVVQTTPDQTSLLAPQPSLPFPPGTASQLAINVDDTIHFQQLEGVGGTFNDSGAWLAQNKLTPPPRIHLMQDLFTETRIPPPFLDQITHPLEGAGVPLNYVAVQNEPLNQTTGYSSMFMNPTDEGRFIAGYLGPALRAMHFRNQNWNFIGQNVDPNDATPGILGYEHNWDNPKYPAVLLQDPNVRQYLAGVSFHCYAGNVADAQNAINHLYTDIHIYIT